MIFQDPEIKGYQVLRTTSAELQYLLPCMKFCTNTVTLLFLPQIALFLHSSSRHIHHIYKLSYACMSQKQPGTQGSRKLQLIAETFSKDKKCGRLSTDSHSRKCCQVSGRERMPQTAHSWQLLPALHCFLQREFQCTTDRALQAHYSSSPPQPGTQCIYHRHMTTYFKYQQALCWVHHSSQLLKVYTLFHFILLKHSGDFNLKLLHWILQSNIQQCWPRGEVPTMECEHQNSPQPQLIQQ